jgi:hypothetical protein
VEGQHIDLKKTQWLGYSNAWKTTGRPEPNFSETVKTSVQQESAANYYEKVNHFFLLDKFNSRDALIAFVNRKLRTIEFRKKMRYWLSGLSSSFERYRIKISIFKKKDAN